MNLDRVIALGQLVISVLFLGGYFTVLILFMMGYARVPTDYKEAFVGLLSLMTGGGLTILYFWFQRSRGLPAVDPETTAVTQTTETVITPKKEELHEA